MEKRAILRVGLFRPSTVWENQVYKFSLFQFRASVSDAVNPV